MAKMPQPTDALRLQLEGRWERLEQAQERYSKLTRQLSSWSWRLLLRSQPALLAEVQAQEPALDEVLAYMERRAQLERWPRSHPGHASLHLLRSQRARLEDLGRKRLAQVVPQDFASFSEVLSQLETLVRAPLPRPPGEHEPVLLTGSSWPSPSRFWLTPQRLVWSPWLGEPEQVLVRNLQPGSITLLPGGLGVRVEGERRFTVSSVWRARPLAALLELYRELPQEAPPQRHGVMIRPAYLNAMGSGRMEDAIWGMGVFWSDYMAFIPERRLSLLDRLRHFVGVENPRDASERQRLKLLVEHLRLLPDAEFERCMGMITRAHGGTLWPSTKVQRTWAKPGELIRFRARAQVLAVPSEGPQSKPPEAPDPALEQFLSRFWPRYDLQFPPSRWVRHAKALVMLGLGLALQFSVAWPNIPSGLTSPLWALGMALQVLACSRYVRSKGHSPLLGLLGIPGCIGWIILAVLPDKNAPSRPSST